MTRALIPDFSAISSTSLLLLVNFASALWLRALCALLFSICIFSLSLHPWQVSKLLFFPHYQHCLHLYGVTLLTSVNPTECLSAPLVSPSKKSFDSIICDFYRSNSPSVISLPSDILA